MDTLKEKVFLTLFVIALFIIVYGGWSAVFIKYVHADEYSDAYLAKQGLHEKEFQEKAAVIMAKRFEREKRVLASGFLASSSQSIMAVDNSLFINPISGVITSGVGGRDIGDGAEHHKGLDIAAATGTPIKAAAGGVVYYSGVMGTYGNVVILDHFPTGNNRMTVYAHQSRLAVYVGQEVQQGQVIGYVGSTGRSTGPHLHFEVHEGAWNSGRTNYVNPLKYISL